MRRVNAVTSIGIMLLFLVHAVAGMFQLFGILPGGIRALSVCARALVILVLLHMGIGAVLTAQSFRTARATGTWYWKENRLFWVRRISGLALLLMLLVHLAVFMQVNRGTFRLHDFGAAELIGQLLLVLCLLVHILSNIRPLLLSFGFRGIGDFRKDLIFLLAFVLLLAALAFVVYYLRWNVFWRV